MRIVLGVSDNKKHCSDNDLYLKIVDEANNVRQGCLVRNTVKPVQTINSIR